MVFITRKKQAQGLGVGAKPLPKIVTPFLGRGLGGGVKNYEKVFSLLLLLFITMLIFLFCPNRALAVKEVNKKLEMKQNHSHLLCFDEKITRYRLGEKNAFKVEILPDIYNSRHEMIIRPIKKVETNLIVWTQNRVYNFDIKTKKGRNLTQFFKFKEKQELPEEVLSALDGMELDMPPEGELKSKSYDVADFAIDLPPGLD